MYTTYKQMTLDQIHETIKYISYNKPYIGFSLSTIGTIIVLKDHLPTFLDFLQANQNLFNITAVTSGMDANSIINQLQQSTITKLNKKQIREILFSFSEEELQELGYKINEEKINNIDDDQNEKFINDYSYQLLDVQQIKEILDKMTDIELSNIGLIKFS